MELLSPRCTSETFKELMLGIIFLVAEFQTSCICFLAYSIPVVIENTMTSKNLHRIVINVASTFCRRWLDSVSAFLFNYRDCNEPIHSSTDSFLFLVGALIGHSRMFSMPCVLAV